MALVRYDLTPVRDKNTGEIRSDLAGSTVRVVLRDTITPAAIYEDADGEVAITSSRVTVLPTFAIPTIYHDLDDGLIDWLDEGSGARGPILSEQGLADVAVAAKQDAASSASAAQGAQIAAEGVASELAGAVRSVNGQEPDESGNVNVAGGGGGGVVSVAGRGPNGSGDVPLTTGDIGAAPASHTHSASDVTSGVFARARLGTGSASASTWLRGDGTWAPAGAGGGDVSSVNGQGPDGSGDVTISKSHIGLGAVDNTSDASKPVSSAQQAALDQKAADNAVVKLTGAQTIAGTKTFSSPPVVPDSSFSQAKVAGLATALGGKVGSSTIDDIWVGSQAAYDALGSYDANTLYLTTGA